MQKIVQNKPTTLRKPIKVIRRVKATDQTEDLLYKGSGWGER